MNMSENQRALATTSYTHLRNTIQATLSEGHLRAQKAVERERVITYWAVGDHLVKFLKVNPAEYGTQVMKQLSADVGIIERTLYDIVRFRRLIQKLPSIAILSWTHYRKLVGVEHVGIGPDFTWGMSPIRDRALFGSDAMDEGHRRFVKGFENISELPNVKVALGERGWSDTEIELVLGGNWLKSPAI